MIERERLAVLSELRILDSPPEEEFDTIVSLACSLLNTPMALVSLIGERRQWTKAAAGMEPGGEMPRRLAFCDTAIRTPGVMVVEDASKDPRFADNDLVTGEMGLRFYAGAPLVVDDYRMGTLCVLDTEPRLFGVSHQQTLAKLSSVVSALMAGRKGIRLLEERHAEVIDRTLTMHQQNRKLRHLAATAAHDMQQPLRSVLGFLHILSEDPDLKPQSQALLDRARRASDKLGKVFRSVMADARQMPIEATLVDLNHVMDDVVIAMQSACEQHNATIVVDKLPAAFADPISVFRIITNLVHNALKNKHADRRSLVRVSGEACGDQVCLYITDNSKGMAATQVADATADEQSDGLGLGFIVCRKLARA